MTCAASAADEARASAASATWACATSIPSPHLPRLPCPPALVDASAQASVVPVGHSPSDPRPMPRHSPSDPRRRLHLRRCSSRAAAVTRALSRAAAVARALGAPWLRAPPLWLPLVRGLIPLHLVNPRAAPSDYEATVAPACSRAGRSRGRCYLLRQRAPASSTSCCFRACKRASASWRCAPWRLAPCRHAAAALLHRPRRRRAAAAAAAATDCPQSEESAPLPL